MWVTVREYLAKRLELGEPGERGKAALCLVGCSTADAPQGECQTETALAPCL